MITMIEQNKGKHSNETIKLAIVQACACGQYRPEAKSFSRLVLSLFLDILNVAFVFAFLGANNSDVRSSYQ